MKIETLQLRVAPEWKLGMVVSRFNAEICQKLEHGAYERLLDLGAGDHQILQLSVPGAVEIPLAVQELFKRGCDGVIALGAVVRGETPHFDYVCQSVERGCSQLALQFHKPVAFGVLTTNTEEQALERVGGQHGHKGREAADVIVEMIQLTKEMRFPL